ncbi:glycosyltransferase family 61 protein [Kordiimonas gwangyangensis]|uniref:glycosyltransferase family 61 protein n=1 Tax=Kordiimonas gwangyangensis TaxID=288022 RepID=UPI00036EA6AA|nr:glycosyltransferase 61 family protein [Kordiimonas gwangyangensis]
MTTTPDTPCYTDAILLPLHGCEDQAFLAGGAKGGVFDRDHQPIEHAFLIRQYRQGAVLINGDWDRKTGTEINTSRMNLPREVGETKHHLKGQYIFAGYLFPHYGHFLLESLSRLWYIKENPDLPILWLGVHNQGEFNAMQRELFDLLGVKNPMHIITEQTSVEELFVPHDGYIIHTRYTEPQTKALKVRGACAPVKGKKVWLSRTKLDKGIVFNEPEFERILELNGWTLYHPQEHSIREQVDMLADAEHIAGIEGSALHTLVLIPEFQGRVTIMGRADKVNFDYCLIADVLNLKQRILGPKRLQWSSGLMKWEANWVWANFDQPLEELGAKRLNKPWQELPRSLENITKSIAGFYRPRTCVEFWPSVNSMTVHAKPARAVVVGERMDFDLAPLEKAGISRMEMTADQFLTTRPVGGSISLFCFRTHDKLDEMVRAFNASLTLSTPKSFWIIEGGSNTNERFLARLYDDYPTVGMARVRSSDIVVVWRATRHMHKPIHGDMDMSGDDFRAQLMTKPLNSIAKIINEQFEKILEAD